MEIRKRATRPSAGSDKLLGESQGRRNNDSASEHITGFGVKDKTRGEWSAPWVVS